MGNFQGLDHERGIHLYHVLWIADNSTVELLNVKINPNNFFKRELDILPPHFVNTVVKAHEADVEKMRKWIYENCSGRYSITKDVVYQGDRSRSCTVLGFENPGDLTLFALSGKAQINQN